MQSKPLLSVSGVDVWFDSLLSNEADLHHYWQLLSCEEQAKAGRFMQERHRRRYVVCHGKMRLKLGAYLNVAPASIGFARNAFGKPAVLDASGRQPTLAFNLSHSADWMVLAVGQRPLGIDLEVWDERHNLTTLAESVLAPEEKIYWHGLPAAERTPAFYRFWTRKESLVKAVGVGIGVGVAGIVTSTSGQPCFRALPAACQSDANWQLTDLALAPAMSAALTVQAGD
ncbi:MAG: phosphopantetheinyl transferase [Methylomonas sp.]|nr:MAG: phosphopantetheinyl transferase [Methylomonas sp.]PPD27846.1 MAG: phosphopantetheinyl transferase [Methylomonas sp.]PPD39955.1 MAG: phosphopantetheinyl transferase [Methylomonas sp.]PPD41065.1 MAG: phosphopantetheinyl transferase [Methylomonas sp.]PPD52051.1 MAG: phosphopantetheinyl transferase [Methylomonas sp.]